MIDIPFYESLPSLKRFEDTSDPINYHPLPDDWFIAITDVRNSTIAIENGRYKEVNAMGAISIMGVLNITGSYNFPFIFGGDGATIAIPGSIKNEVLNSLRGVQILAKTEFDLDIRAGLIPVSHIRKHGHEVNVARVQVSSYYHQAAFIGGGIQFADNLLKDPFKGPEFHVENLTNNSDSNFAGMECRWEEVRNKRGEVHSLLIEATVQDPEEKSELYRHIYELIRTVYGDEDDHKPIRLDSLKMTLSNRDLSVEKNIQTHDTSLFNRVKYWLMLRYKWILGIILMRYNVKTEVTEWGSYKPDLVENTDYRKFDDMLRMVLAGTKEHRETINEMLDSLYKKGKIIYGIHHAESALITCVILNHQKGHIHLVDGSDGGYAIAAKMMKKQTRST